MAFLEDEDAVRAVEAALLFVEQQSMDTPGYTLSPYHTGASDSVVLPVDDSMFLSPSILPSSLPPDCASLNASYATTMPSPSSPAFQLLEGPSAKLHLGLPATNTVSTKRKEVGRSRNKTAGGVKKRLTRGDPNRARNERKIELAYLREKATQLELELRTLQLHPRSPTRRVPHKGENQETEATKQKSTMSVYNRVQVPSVWKEVASRQHRRREKAERENVRLRLILKNQVRMAKGLESLLQKRAKQQVVECSSLAQTKKYSQGRTLDFRVDVNEFKGLLAHLDRAYREIDAVFAANGLATMETTHRDARMRREADYMYLDIFASKVMPFEMRATAQAVWNHYKGAEKHRGNIYEGKVAKHLEAPDTPDTIMEDFAKEFFADSARADFHAKQVLRRYVEKDREIVIWVASVVPLEFDDQRVKGLGFRHQGYALTKRSNASTSNRDFSLLQLCSLVRPEKEKHTVYDPSAVRALTNFMLGTVAGNITASQELIENALVDRAVK